VSIGANPSPRSKRLISAARVVVRYDWRALIRASDDIVRSIHEVEVQAPELTATRDSKGAWDLARHFEGSHSASAGRFRGVVRVRNGRLRVADWAGPVAQSPAGKHLPVRRITRLESFAADFDTRDGPWATFSAVSGLHGSPDATVAVQGAYRLDNQSWFGRLHVRNFDASHWLKYAGLQGGLRVEAGLLDAEMSALGRSSTGGWTGESRVTLRDATAHVPGLGRPLRTAAATMIGDRSMVRFEGQGSIASASVRFTGYSLYRDQSRFQVNFEASPGGLQPLHEVFPQAREVPGLVVDGPIHLRGSVAGDGTTIRSSGTVRTDLALYRSAEISAVEIEWRSAGETVELSRFSAHLARGMVEGEGRLQVGGGNPVLVLRGRAADLQLATFRDTSVGNRIASAYGLQALSGQASIEFIVRGSLDQPEAAGEVKVVNLSLGRVRLADAQARWQLKDQHLTLTGLRLDDPLGRSQITGWVDGSGEIDLDVRLVVPSLKEALAEVQGPELGGSALFKGRVSGDWNEPRLRGDLRLMRASWLGRNFDNIDAHVEVQGKKVILRDVDIRMPPAHVSVPELVFEPNEAGTYHVRGGGSVDRLSISQIVRLCGQGQLQEKEPLLGDATATFSAEGSLDAVRITIVARARSVAAKGLRLGDISARIEASVADSSVRIISARAIKGPQVMELTGQVARASSAEDEAILALTLEGTNTPFLPMARRLWPEMSEYVQVTGELARFRIAVRGPSSAPLVGGEITTSALSINGEGFQPTGCRFSWSSEGVTVTDLELSAQKSRAQLRIPALAWVGGSGSPATPLPQRVAGELLVSGVPLNQLRSLIRQGPSAEFEAVRQLRAWLAQLPSTAEGDLGFQVSCPTPVLVNSNMSGDDWRRLSEARLAHPATMVVARVPEFSLAVLSAEEAGADREVRRIRLDVGVRLIVEPNRWVLDDLRIDQRDGDALVNASGWWEPVGPKNADARMQAEVSAVNIPLSAVSGIPVPELQRYIRSIQPMQGMAEIHAVATGSARSPNVQMSASVDRPMIAGLEFSELNADQIEVDSDEGELRLHDVDFVQRHEGHSHRIRLAGSLPFTWAPAGIVPDRRRNLTIRLSPQPLDLLNDLAATGSRPNPTRALRLWEVPKDGGGLARDALQWDLQARLQQLRKALASLDVTDGSVEASFTLGGTANVPENNGFIALSGGRLRLGGGDTAIEGLDGRLTFAGNELRVERLVGASNRTGGFQVTGGARLGREVTGGPSAELDLALEINQFRFLEERLDHISAELRGTGARGTLQSVEREVGREPAPIRITGPWNHPRVAGAVRLTNAISGLPTSFPEGRSLTPGLVDADLDLRLFLGENVQVKNAFLDMRLSNGITVSNTLAAPVVSGRIIVQRGTLQLPTMRFRIEGGIRVNFDGRRDANESGAVGPLYVDLRGITHMALRESPGLPAEDFEVILLIRGSPSGDGTASTSRSILRTPLPGQLLVGGGGEGLSIELHSDPPLPSQQLSYLIRQQLGLQGITASEGNLQAVLQNQVQLALANSVAPLLTSRIEDYVQQTLGLDVFAIEVGGLEQPLQLRVGKRIFGDIFGSFTQRFGAPVETTRSLELYYRLTPQLRFGARQEDPLNRRYLFLSGSVKFK